MPKMKICLTNFNIRSDRFDIDIDIEDIVIEKMSGCVYTCMYLSNGTPPPQKCAKLVTNKNWEGPPPPQKCAKLVFHTLGGRGEGGASSKLCKTGLLNCRDGKDNFLT